MIPTFSLAKNSLERKQYQSHLESRKFTTLVSMGSFHSMILIFLVWSIPYDRILFRIVPLDKAFTASCKEGAEYLHAHHTVRHLDSKLGARYSSLVGDRLEPKGK